jgi:predicted aldo/keto reductase-like oxidoreductase
VRYRTLGRTGLEVGEIGLGTEYLHGQPRETVVSVVAEAVARGVNYVDIIFSFADYLDNLGAALKGRRNRITLALHLGCAETDGQYRRSRDVAECERNFTDMLRRLGTDHADVIVVQNCDEQDDYDEVMREGGVLDLAERLRREGKGRFLGFSGHSVPVPAKAVESGRFEVLMVSISARDASPAHRDLYHLCARENVGLVGMKPFAGGAMFRPEEGRAAPSPVQCLGYVLSQPGVCTTVPGMRSVEELRAGLRYFEATAEERDYSALLTGVSHGPAGACTYCNHCQPCTQGIDVGGTMRLLDLAAHGVSMDLRLQYRALPGAPASACVACGQCRERCPFGVDTPARMKEAARVFEAEERV